MLSRKGFFVFRVSETLSKADGLHRFWAMQCGIQSGLSIQEQQWCIFANDRCGASDFYNPAAS
jgi:hypothetical protein